MSCTGFWLPIRLSINSSLPLAQSFVTSRDTVTWSPASLAGAVLRACSLRRFGCSWHPTEIISVSLAGYPRDHLGPIVQDSGGRNLLCSGIISANRKCSWSCVSAGPHFRPDLSCHTEVSVVTEQPTSGPWKAGQGTVRETYC